MAWYKCSGGGEGIPLITKSGSIVEYEDSVGGVPVNDLVAQIVATQSGSGDPSPSNIRPISGWTGANVTRTGINLWNEDWEVGGINDTTGQPNSDTNKIRSKSFFAIKGGETYYVVAPQPIRILFYADDESFISETSNIRNNTFSVPANASKAKIRGTVDYGTVYNRDISINYPATDTAYHAYNGTTYSVTWQNEAGTVYGGYIDLTTGLLTVTWMDFYFDGSESVSAIGQSSGTYYATVTKSLTGINSTAQIPHIKSDKFLGATGVIEGHCYVTYNGTYLVAILPQTVTTIQQATEWFQSNPTHFVYELATPLTYQLTPTEVKTLLGVNNIFADTGDIAVKFYKPVTNLDTLVEQTKELAPDIIALASAGDGSTTRVGFDLTDDTIGTKATRIPDYMFFKNINVENISLSNIETVGEYAFENATYIKSINLPACVTLKKEAFYNACNKHTSSTLSSLTINLPSVSVVNDGSLRNIGYSGGLTATLNLDSCTEIKDNGCRGEGGKFLRISELNLPSLTILGGESFNYQVIDTVDIGSSCTQIKSKPFNYGTIGTLIVRAVTPPTLHANGLGATPTHIYVPADSVATYKAASNWSTYASIIEAIPT